MEYCQNSSLHLDSSKVQHPTRHIMDTTFWRLYFFYRSDDPINSVKALNGGGGVVSHPDSSESHQAHLTILQQYSVHAHIIQDNGNKIYLPMLPLSCIIMFSPLVAWWGMSDENERYLDDNVVWVVIPVKIQSPKWPIKCGVGRCNLLSSAPKLLWFFTCHLIFTQGTGIIITVAGQLLSSSSSFIGMHHQCVAPLAANSLHSGLFRASSIASSKVRLCRARSFFRVAIQEVYGHPTGILHSLWGTAVRILLAFADSPDDQTAWVFVFCMIEVRGGCSVRRRTSQLETRWYQRISKILLRHHWSSASSFLASTLDGA